MNTNKIYTQLFKNTIKDTHYIYLVKPSTFINTNKTIYKVGKLRLNSFINNDTEVILFRKCISSNNIERLILNKFNCKYPKYTLNNNYFIGDVEDMADTISDIIKNERKSNIKKNNSVKIVNERKDFVKVHGPPSISGL